jgi:hypothetical protein
MANLPEDRGPDSLRVAKLDLENPIHFGIVNNKENNPNAHITHNGKNSIIAMSVKSGNEAPPSQSSKYPSFDTETEPYNPKQVPTHGPENKLKKSKPIKKRLKEDRPAPTVSKTTTNTAKPGRAAIIEAERQRVNDLLKKKAALKNKKNNGL